MDRTSQSWRQEDDQDMFLQWHARFLWFHYNNSRTVDHCDFKLQTTNDSKEEASNQPDWAPSHGEDPKQWRISFPPKKNHPSYHCSIVSLEHDPHDGEPFFDWLPWNYGRKATKIPREAHLCAHNDVSWVGFQNTASSKLQCFKPLSKASWKSWKCQRS